MNSTFLRNLLLVLAGCLLGALLVNPPLSIAQDADEAGTSTAEPVASAAPAEAPCKRWEVTQWSPKEDGECNWKGSSPYSHRGEWCAAPEGAEIIDALSAGEAGDLYRFWIKRCAER